MIYKKLGSSAIKVSSLGIGTNGIGNFQNNSREKTYNRQKIYKFALDNDINLFDSAELYGEGYAEYILGKTFKGKRSQVVITSKVNPDNCTHIRLKKAIKESLKRLQTNYIDLYQIHWLNPFVDLEETMNTLEELVLGGYIKAVGVCNFSIPMVIEAAKFLKKIKIASNHIEINLFNQHELINNFDFYTENKISLIGYGALNHLNFILNKRQKVFLDNLQKKYNKNLPQILIGYFTSFENLILLTRTDNMEHLKNNLDSFSFTLTKEELQNFRNLFKFRLQNIPLRSIKIPKKFNNFDILKNSDRLIPSPLIIAQTYVKYNFFKPLKVQEKDGNYCLDNYDFYGELKKYFAWNLLYGFSKPIPSIVFKHEV